MSYMFVKSAGKQHRTVAKFNSGTFCYQLKFYNHTIAPKRTIPYIDDLHFTYARAELIVVTAEPRSTFLGTLGLRGTQVVHPCSRL